MKTSLYCASDVTRTCHSPFDVKNGTWLEGAPGRGQWANVLLEITNSGGAGSPIKALMTLLPSCELRVGLWATPGDSGRLAAWAATRTEPNAVALTEEQLAWVEKLQTIRSVRQFLWVRAPLERFALASSADELATLAVGALKYLNITSAPAVEYLAIADSYLDPSSSMADQPDCDLRVEKRIGQPTPYTAYAKPNKESSSLNFMTELLDQLTGSFTMWSTWSPLPAEEGLSALSTVFGGGRQLTDPIKSERANVLLEHAKTGNWGKVQQMITLPDENSVDVKKLFHAANAARLKLLPASQRWLGILPHRTDMLATFDEASQWTPWVSVEEKPESASGVLLENESGNLLPFDVFNGNDDRNVVIAGCADHQMAFVGRALVESHLAGGNPAWIVEDDEFSDMVTELYAGKKIVIRDTDTGLNPLAMPLAENQLNMLTDWLIVMAGPKDTAVKRERLAAALSDAYREAGGIPVSLHDICDQLRRYGDAISVYLLEDLSRYLGEGQYGSLFTGKPIDLGITGLNTIQLDCAGDVAAKCTATLAVMLQLHWEANPTTVKKMACLSTTADLAAHVANPDALESYGTLLERVLRVSRKWNGSWVTMAGAWDLPNDRQAPIVVKQLQNSNWKILLKDCTRVLNYINVDEHARVALTKVRGDARKNFVLSGPGVPGALRHMLVSPTQAIALSGKWSHVNAYWDLRNASLTPMEAITTISNRR